MLNRTIIESKSDSIIKILLWFHTTKEKALGSARRLMKLNTSKITALGLWDAIREHEGKQFLTKKGLPFTYTIKGGELFTDRRERSITRSTFEKAYEKLVQDQVGEDAPKKIVGPKTLNLYGAPYIWAVFLGIGLIEEPLYIQEEMELPKG